MRKIRDCLNEEAEKREKLENQYEELKENYDDLIRRVGDVEKKLSNSMVSGQGLQALYEGSNIMVSPLKLALVNLSDWRSCVNNLITLLFSVSEIYQRTAIGTKSNEGSPKEAIDKTKLAAIYSFVKIKFQDFYEANKVKDRWKSMINDVINKKLGCYNRHFNYLVQKYTISLSGEEEQLNQIKEYSISSIDKSILEDYKIFSNDPSRFLALNRPLNSNDEEQQREEEEQ